MVNVNFVFHYADGSSDEDGFKVPGVPSVGDRVETVREGQSFWTVDSVTWELGSPSDVRVDLV